jgi:TolA-binding protein
VRYLESGRTKEGIKSLREYLKVGTPEEYRVDANRRCAEASVSLGEKVRAAEYYRDAAHWGDRQDGIDYRFEAGRLFFEAGKFGPAREEFDRVLKLKPDGETRHLTLYNLGLTLKELKQVDAALEAFREVAVDEAAKARTRADAMLEAGLILRDRGQQDAAKEMLCGGAAALGTGSTGAEGQYWCSEFDFEAGRLDDAVAGYFRILREFAGEKEWGLSARYRLAESFEKLNRWTNAREQYEEIVKRSDDDAWRADAQKRLDWIKENSWVFDEKPRGDPSRWKSQG